MFDKQKNKDSCIYNKIKRIKIQYMSQINFFKIKMTTILMKMTYIKKNIMFIYLTLIGLY